VARYELRDPPVGYAIRGNAATGYWPLRAVLPGMWQDIGGPYKERWYAVRKAEADARKQRAQQSPSSGAEGR
jgi:hypothetical protein